MHAEPTPSFFNLVETLRLFWLSSSRVAAQKPLPHYNIAFKYKNTGHQSPSVAIIRHHSPSFAIIRHHSPSFAIIRQYSPTLANIRLYFPNTYCSSQPGSFATMPRTSLLQSIYMISEELNQYGTIPSHRLGDLQDRLSIACNRPRRQLPGDRPRDRKQILANTRRNRAHREYLKILDRDCHTFFPYILGVSPRSCVKFDAEKFLQTHDSSSCRVYLKRETRSVIENIAKDGDFIESPHFARLIRLIFPGGMKVYPLER